MCHINLIKRKDEYCDTRINFYMDVVSWSSFRSNSDGEGYIGFDSRKFIVDRTIGKIVYNELPAFHTIISHQRYSTSGFTLSNTHPHESKDFILQHNGVFHGIGDKEVSDTKIYLSRFQELYNLTNDILVCIKTLDKEISGSYSIVLFDKNTERIYYYKNSSTAMFILDDKKYLVMSTAKNNLEIAKMYFKMKSSIKEVHSDILYEITTHGLKFLSRIKPKEKKVLHLNTFFANEFSKNNYDDYWNKKMLESTDADLNDYYIDERGKRIRL